MVVEIKRKIVRRLWKPMGRMEQLVVAMNSDGSDSFDGTVVKKEKVRVNVVKHTGCNHVVGRC